MLESHCKTQKKEAIKELFPTQDDNARDSEVIDLTQDGDTQTSTQPLKKSKSSTNIRVPEEKIDIKNQERAILKEVEPPKTPFDI